MIDLGKYASDVLLAYGITLALVLGLIAYSINKARKVKAQLAALEDSQNG